MLLFIHMSQSVFGTAITIVSMASEGISSSVLIGKAIYLGIFFMQNYLLCYLGNEINVEVPKR